MRAFHPHGTMLSSSSPPERGTTGTPDTSIAPTSWNRAGSKRPIQSRSSNDSGDNSSLDCATLHHSLKRVKLSSSPGELCLNRDLLHLVRHEGWRVASVFPHIYNDSQQQQHDADNDDRWISPCHTQLLTRQDPLRLEWRTQHVLVVLQIPRLYPHRPPTVRIVPGADSPSFNWPRDIVWDASGVPLDVHESTSGAPLFARESSSSSSSATLRLEWSPIQRLTDVMRTLQQTLCWGENTQSPGQQHQDKIDKERNDRRNFNVNNEGSAKHPGGNPYHNDDMVMDPPEAHTHRRRSPATLPSTTNSDTWLPPNRFDWGFDRLYKMDQD